MSELNIDAERTLFEEQFNRVQPGCEFVLGRTYNPERYNMEIIEQRWQGWLAGRLTCASTVLQSTGSHPSPCARQCEAPAFKIEIRRLEAQIVRKAAA